MTATGLIPRRRLANIPRELRLAHEYCYFLHDQGVHLLGQYEAARAHIVTTKFKNRRDAKTFQKLAGEGDAVSAMRTIGYTAEARRVVLNTITMAMVSDCLHHIFEALQCFEKRKFVVALNLLRKPLVDNLVYLSWMLGDEDSFYQAFSSGDPEALSPRKLGNFRSKIIAQALAKTDVADVLTPELVLGAIFDPKNQHGLYGVFQHAVHLVTVDRPELRTSPENFNFIFKSPYDDDTYHSVYEQLPGLLLYLMHVMLELFQRMAAMDPGAKRAFEVRSIFGLYLVEGGDNFDYVLKCFTNVLAPELCCPDCKAPLKITLHNASRIVLTESFRCTTCRVVAPFPFAWLF